MFTEPQHNAPLKLSYYFDEEHLRTKLLNLLLQAGAKIDARSPDIEGGRTPLQRAARHKLSEALEILLAAGANVHMRDSTGATALFNVCLPPWGSWRTDQDKVSWEAHIEQDMIRLLLDHGSRINATNNHGRTALHTV